MTKYNDNFADIFANLKDGDCLGFYRKAWYLQIIPFFTREDKGEKPPQHVGICYNVKRKNDSLSFNFSEQSIHGGKFDSKKIYKTSDGYITDDAYFIKQDTIYYGQLRRPLTEEGRLAGIADAISQLDKKHGYNYLSLALGPEFLERILPKFIKDLIIRYTHHWERVCSTHCYINSTINGSLKSVKDFFTTPIEFLKLPEFFCKQFSSF